MKRLTFGENALSRASAFLLLFPRLLRSPETRYLTLKEIQATLVWSPSITWFPHPHPILLGMTSKYRTENSGITPGCARETMVLGIDPGPPECKTCALHAVLSPQLLEDNFDKVVSQILKISLNCAFFKLKELGSHNRMPTRQWHKVRSFSKIMSAIMYKVDWNERGKEARFLAIIKTVTVIQEEG